MSSQSKTVSPLRQRMIEDMRMRKLAPQTQAAYIRAVRKFARYLNRAPDTATAEDLRNFQLHLVDHGASPITLNATITVSSRSSHRICSFHRGNVQQSIHLSPCPKTPSHLSLEEPGQHRRRATAYRMNTAQPLLRHRN